MKSTIVLDVTPCSALKISRLSGGAYRFHLQGRRITKAVEQRGKTRRKETTRRRLRRRWVDNIRMDLGEVEWGGVEWIGLAQDRNRWRALVNSVLNLRVP
jgi:hypothetical protein